MEETSWPIGPSPNYSNLLHPGKGILGRGEVSLTDDFQHKRKTSMKTKKMLSIPYVRLKSKAAMCRPKYIATLECDLGTFILNIRVSEKPKFI